MCDPPLRDWQGLSAELLHHALHSVQEATARLSWANPASLWQGDGTCEVQTLPTAGTGGDRSPHTQCHGYCTSSCCIHQAGSRRPAWDLLPALLQTHWQDSSPCPQGSAGPCSPGSGKVPFWTSSWNAQHLLSQCTSSSPSPLMRERDQDAFAPGWCLV